LRKRSKGIYAFWGAMALMLMVAFAAVGHQAFAKGHDAVKGEKQGTSQAVKSNGVLEIIAFYAPEFVAFRAVGGKEFKKIDVFFYGRADIAKASNVKVFGDRNVIHAADFKNVSHGSAHSNRSADLSFKAREIRFRIDGEDMRYNLETSQWESGDKTEGPVSFAEPSDASQVFDPNAVRKSNGTLEVISIYAPDIVVFRPAPGKEFKTPQITVHFHSAAKDYQGKHLRALSVTVDKNWNATYTNKSEIRITNFDTPPDFQAQKVIFKVDRKTMRYDLVNSAWE